MVLKINFVDEDLEQYYQEDVTCTTAQYFLLFESEFSHWFVIKDRVQVWY